ncbi:putative MxaK-like protein [Paraburkholderia ribeironis]|uniref:Putative MxaK-like protein n=1 Tax=Paraburkholderia ribeironis TaxID=1247936 RepID=A0A1N7RTM0_9BURK|nr:MxaK protein [Paraburkholderia ribeironis]SIT38455.1 putative MxaK-like protein [Paraburkholderia ribeironis]
MTRTLMHGMFGTIALCCAGWAAYDWTQLQDAGQINQAVAAVTAVTAVTAVSAASVANGKPGEDPAAADAPQVRLARATALSKAGAYDAAGRLYAGLIHDDRLDDLGRTALFDLANMYLREGAGEGAASTVKSLNMIGEAKAGYRRLLRAAPDDWDARYNLERALWLAPETDGAPVEPNVKSQHNVTVRDPQSKDLP